MKEKSDVEFESLLRSLVLTPEEMLLRDALQEEIRAHVTTAFCADSSKIGQQNFEKD